MTEANFPLPEGTHTVILGLGDLHGLMRGKRIPADQWPRICSSGNALAMSLFTMDMTCDVWETPVVGFANGFPDCHIFPMHAPVAVPWEPGVAMCFARAEGMDHGPLTVDPRQTLLRQVERAAAMHSTVGRVGIDGAPLSGGRVPERGGERRRGAPASPRDDARHAAVQWRECRGQIVPR